MPNASDFVQIHATVPVTIANGTALSAALDFTGASLCAIAMPAAWTTANLTFQASADGTTFYNLFDKTGTEYSVTAAASQFLIIPPTDMAGIRYLKVRSGTSGAAVNQGANRVLTLIVRPV